MKIIKKSIAIFTDDFFQLTDTLEGPNYVPVLEGASFRYEGNDLFTIEHLQDLYGSDDKEMDIVEGKIEHSTYQNAKKQIRYALSFVSNIEAHGFEAKKSLIRERESSYWAIVHKYFPEKPILIFSHKPEYNSYFGEYVMWNFVFIFLKSGKGVVLAGKAWD